MKCDCEAAFSVSVTALHLVTNPWGVSLAMTMMLAIRAGWRYKAACSAASYSSACSGVRRGERRSKTVPCL